MKKSFKYVPGILMMMLIFSSCEKDYYYVPRVDVTIPISFSTDIKPLLTTNCAGSNCHEAGGISPDLTPGNAYTELTSAGFNGQGYIDTANAEQSLLYQRIVSITDPMPPSGNMTAEEIGKILTWIKQGAQNN